MSVIDPIANPVLVVALIQHDIVWLKPKDNLRQLQTMLIRVLRSQSETVDLILLPETFATGFAVDLGIAEGQGGPILQWLIDNARQFNTTIAGSVLVQDGDRQVNRFYWVEPDGGVQYYDKRHLFRLGNEGDYIAPGDERKIFTIKGFRVLPQVCYDLRFPVFQRNCNDYDIMVNVANWPASRRKVWDTLLMARAMENQCYVLACNRIGFDGRQVAHNGGSAAYDFTGESILLLPDDRSAAKVVTLHKEPLDAFRAGFPAHLDADKFTLL